MARKKNPVVVTEKPFRAMDLPPEIRTRVWRFAVVTDHPIEVKEHWHREIVLKMLPPSTLRSGKQIESHRKDDVVRVTSVLAIAFTCRQVYLEVTPIYYSQNVFRFQYFRLHDDSATMFARAIGKKKAQSITSAIIGLFNGDDPDFSCVPGLQRLDIESSSDWLWMGINKKRALHLHARKNPNLVLTVAGLPWEFSD